jgi:hypothetical protein
MSAQYFAQVDDNNVVVRVNAVQREFMEENPDRYTGTWIETFMDTPGKTYASIGYTYSPETGDFTDPFVEQQIE